MMPHPLRTAAAAAALVTLALTGCQGDDPPPTDEPTTPTPSASTPTPLSAGEVAQEAVRLWNVDRESEPDWREELCALFTPDALNLAPANDGDAVPMSRWCGQNSNELPATPVWEVADQTPSIEEEQRQGDETWIRLMVGARPEHQYAVALVQDDQAGEWRIARWCEYGASQETREVEGGDDPFHCLEVTQ